jgi:hypothetical protein
MQITIPDRILEAINQGDALKISKFADKYCATLTDPDANQIYGRLYTTAQAALADLNDRLPPTMKETALMDSKKGGLP